MARSPKQEKACLSPTRAGSLSRFAFLPPELVTEILLLCASPAGGVATNIALLSWSHHALIMPRLYGNVSLCTPRAFRLFRTTLALHNPILGKYVRTLQVGSALFDRPGYVPDLLAEQTALAVGLEQILLACPALQGFQIDLFALAALATGTAARLERGAQPVRLSTELALPAYLALPTFAHTEHLSLLAFGLDAVAALEVCAVLPRLKSLSVRWVTRNEDAHREEDTQMVVQAIDSLLEWPPDSRTGRPLVALEIRAWPAVVGQLRAAFPRSRDAEEMMDHLEESAIVSLDEEERGDAHKPGLGANSDERSRLFLGLDMERYHGPRKGLHTHWWQEHAFRHWG